MAVLVEATSVIIRADALSGAYPGGWEAFKRDVPNDTMCADRELVRVGFMSPADVEQYVADLERIGLRYLVDGKARDLVVVDQVRGPLAPCEWAEYGHVDLDDDPAKRVAVCRLKGSALKQLVRPPEWEFEGSLTQSFAFVRPEHLEKSLTFLRHENGRDVYRDETTGETFYMGRTGRGDS